MEKLPYIGPEITKERELREKLQKDIAEGNYDITDYIVDEKEIEEAEKNNETIVDKIKSNHYIFSNKIFLQS